MTIKPVLRATSLRIPNDLRHHLKQEAHRNHRSLNSEIIARLEQSRKDDAERAPQQGPAA